MGSSRPERGKVIPLLEHAYERAVLITDSVMLGQFSCAPDDPGFRDAGRIRNYVVAFPRTAVWIQHDGEPSFVADPSVATVYNATQPFERRRIAPEGDRSDWLAVSEPLARELVEALDPTAADFERPLRASSAPVSNALYLRQRRLFDAAARRALDPLAAEEEVLSIFSATLASAMRRDLREIGNRGSRSDRLVVATQRLVMESLHDNLTLTQIASELGSSVFHLCRVFRDRTGQSIHEYRRTMRLRAALGLASKYRGNLSELALTLGFYSHSHFTAAFHNAFGVIPSEYADEAPSLTHLS